MKKAALLMLLVLAVCSACRDAVSGRVHHVVLCWLKEPGNATQRRQLIEASRSFREIPGVREVRAGEPLAGSRPVVDGSFDVAMVFSFTDVQALQAFQAHPAHRQAKTVLLQPLVRKMVVYDFQE